MQLVNGSETNSAQKRLFVVVSGVTFLFIASVLSVLWYVMRPGLSQINQYLPLTILLLIILILLVVFVSIVSIFLTVIGVGLSVSMKKIAWRTLLLLFPAAVFCGRVFGFSKENIEKSFIAISNSFFFHRDFKIPGETIMLMLPHCLQKSECVYKLTQDVNNCHRCGRCDIDELLRLVEKYGVKMHVVTGGTLARRIIKQIKPRLVIAVACERDLSSGIKDVFPLPVYGILNVRPEGPCFNTRVNVNAMEEILKSFVLID